jgi:hypothetical protein
VNFIPDERIRAGGVSGDDFGPADLVRVGRRQGRADAEDGRELSETRRRVRELLGNTFVAEELSVIADAAEDEWKRVMRAQSGPR